MDDLQVVDRIVSACAKLSKVPASAVYGRNRSTLYTRVRHTVWYLIRRWTKLSYTEVGNKFQRSHSVILVACQQEQTRLDRDLPARPGVSLRELHAQIEREVGLVKEEEVPSA